MRSSIWVLEPGTEHSRADAIVQELAALDLHAEVHAAGDATTIVVDDPPDDLERPPDVARAVSIEMPVAYRTTRRTFLDSFATALACAVTGAAVGVGALFASPPPDRGEGVGEIDVVGLDELRERGFKTFRLGREPAVVVFANGKLYALSLVCTHLGCLVAWSPQRHQLVCPCHRASFDLGGNVLSGPPPRPLRSFEVSVQGERVLVRQPGGTTS